MRTVTSWYLSSYDVQKKPRVRVSLTLPVCAQIEEILGTITQAKVTARTAQNKLSSNGGSWWAWLGGSAVDYNTHTYASYDYYDDLGTVDGKRLEAHLDQATANLCAIFDVSIVLALCVIHYIARPTLIKVQD